MNRREHVELLKLVNQALSEILTLRSEIDQLKTQVEALTTPAPSAPEPSAPSLPYTLTWAPVSARAATPAGPETAQGEEDGEVGDHVHDDDEDHQDDLVARLSRMSPRHHAALQMILRGAENSEIGRRFGVSESGAKTYVWGLYQHLGLTKAHGHNKRAIVVALLKSLIDAMSDEDYRRIAGIPKDWDRRYDEIGKDWQPVFDRTARVKRR